jgi:putative ATP-binding cassette transporter
MTNVIVPAAVIRGSCLLANLSFGFWTGPTRRKAKLFVAGLLPLLLVCPGHRGQPMEQVFFDALQNKDHG